MVFTQSQACEFHAPSIQQCGTRNQAFRRALVGSQNRRRKSEADDWLPKSRRDIFRAVDALGQSRYLARMVVSLLLLILVILLVGREVFLKGVVSVAVIGIFLVHFAVVLGCVATLVFLVELTVWAGTTDLTPSFTQWFWKHSVCTLWLPALAYMTVYVVHGLIVSRKMFPTTSSK
jgi:hypothetical protein